MDLDSKDIVTIIAWSGWIDTEDGFFVQCPGFLINPGARQAGIEQASTRRITGRRVVISAAGGQYNPRFWYQCRDKDPYIACESPDPDLKRRPVSINPITIESAERSVTTLLTVNS